MGSPDGIHHKSMRWFFPKDETILEIGTNSSKFDTSDDAVKMFVRELCQNSCDASSGGKVVIEFDMFNIKRSDFPDYDGFSTVLRRCVKATEKFRDDRSSYELMSDMADEFDKSEITILRASDFGTTGARGSNISDTKELSPWKSMTISQGVSNKTGKSAGSFGRGKGSFYAVSQFHTIFFSTNSDDGLTASIGCSELITHYDDQGTKYSSFGICGDPDFKNNYSCDRMFSFGNYRRDKSQCGTDVFIVGYTQASANWDDQILIAVICDFFLRISRGELRVSVGNKYVDEDNLKSLVKELMAKYPLSVNELGLVLEQIDLISSEPVLKDSIFSLYLGKSEKYNHITSIRGGMVIDRHYKACSSLIGILVIEDDETSRFLSKCEPTNHNKWIKANIQNLSKNQKQKIIQILDYISNCVNDAIDEYAGADSEEEQDAEGLEKYISLHVDTPEQIHFARMEYNWGALVSIRSRSKNKVKKRKTNQDDSKQEEIIMPASEKDSDEDFNHTGAVDRINPKIDDASRNFEPDSNGDMKRVFKINSYVKISNVLKTCVKKGEGLSCTFVYDVSKEKEYYLRVSAVMRGGKSAEQIPILRATDSEGKDIPVVDGYYTGPILSRTGKRNKITLILNYPAICDFRPEVFDYAN